MKIHLLPILARMDQKKIKKQAAAKQIAILNTGLDNMEYENYYTHDSTFGKVLGFPKFQYQFVQP